MNANIRWRSGGAASVCHIQQNARKKTERSLHNHQILSAARRRESQKKLYSFSVKWGLGRIPNKPVAGKRYRAIGKAMEVAGIDRMTDEEAADATIAAVRQLSADVGIPANLRGILKEEDVRFLAESAYADACRPGNPRDTCVKEIVALYKSQL